MTSIQSDNNSCMYDTFVILVYYIGKMTDAGCGCFTRRTDGRSHVQTDRGFVGDSLAIDVVCVVCVSFVPVVSVVLVRRQSLVGWKIYTRLVLRRAEIN